MKCSKFCRRFNYSHDETGEGWNTARSGCDSLWVKWATTANLGELTFEAGYK